MKKAVKIFGFTLIMIIAITATQFAFAEEQNDTMESSVKAVVKDFLENSAYNSFMYTSNELESQAIDSLTAQQRTVLTISPEALVKAQDVVPPAATLALFNDGELEAHRNKVKYFKHIRQSQGIERQNFSVEYEFKTVDIQDNFAKAEVSEMVSFRYTDCSEPSSMGTDYTVYLFNTTGKWYIYDISSNEELDGMFKDESFDLEEVLNDFDGITEYSTDGITHEVDSGLNLARSNVGIYRTYEKSLAASYAFTYTTAGTVNQTSYYNPLFLFLDADCQNFASQCVWAGFGGDNSSTSINSGIAPMDNMGTSRWYGKPVSPYWSWTACSYFRSYLASSSSSSDTRMVADIYDVAGNVNSFTSLPIYPVEMIGCVMHVSGAGGAAYEHAIVINNVTGSTRSDVFFCAHTTHAKNVRLSDKWPAQSTDAASARIKVIVPNYFCEVKDCPGQSAHTYSSISAGNGTDSICNNCGYCRMYVRPNWINPVPVNSTVTLSATVPLQAYRMAMKVEAPNGAITWLNQASNSYSISNSFTFTQTGLYTITVNARDINDSMPGSTTRIGTYQVRIY